jgi:NADP-dependent 3-hydroxy-3-methylglutaryl-CoA reductase
MTTAIPGRGQYTEDARRQRLDWLRARTGSALPALGETGLDARALTGNVENFAGSVEVPVGLAGPLLFTGDAARGSVVAPLATTEGALVASASRGARALTAAGGVTTRVLSQRMSRAPAFEFADIAAAARFTAWLYEHRAALDAQVRLVSRYARLVGVDPYQIGRHLHVRFVFETADAAGQNMTTAATWQICRWLSDTLADEDRLRPLRTLLEGNLSSDKKVSVGSMLAGRGTRVTAECVLPAEVVASILKVTPAAIVKGHLTSTLGAQQAGMVGSGINAANIIAALFTATGQDIASVHESGVSILAMDLDGADLIATILLPSLVTGTVGGGTSLPRQRDWLTTLGCAGAGGSARFAEIIAGFALALDVSTAAALVSGQFADAHQRLGRSRRVDWIQSADLDAAFVQAATGRPVAAVTLGSPLHGDGISSELGALGERRKLTGLVPMTVEWADGERAELVAKIKPRGAEVVAGIAMIASLCGPEVSRAWNRWGADTEFADSHRRELAVYRRAEPVLTDLLPRCFGVVQDEAREAYVVLMERLALPGEPWTTDRIDAALRAIGRVHRHWLGRDDELHDWLHRTPGAAHLVKARELWEALARYNAAEQPGLLDGRRLAVVLDIVDSAGFWTQELEALPRTLVHNDFNPRNVAVLAGRVVVYDWELATAGVGERDVAELLAFTLGPDATTADVDHHLAVHGSSRRGYQLALRELLMSRFQLYLAAHSHREFAFLPGVLDTAFRLWDLESSRDGA